MNKNRLISYSMILLTSLIIFGCGTTDRIDNLGSQNTETPEITDTPEITQDTNITTEVDQDTQISEEDEPAVIDPDTNDPLANSATTTYITEITTNKEVIAIEETAIINYNIKNIFSGELADATEIDKVVLRVNGDYLNFIDQAGNYGTMATLNNPEGTIVIKSLIKSGTTFIELKADIIFKNEDGSNDIKQLTSYLPMGIIKNGSSTMSIIPNYANDTKKRYDADLGLYIDTFTIHVVDKYGNKAKDETKVHVGIVNNLKKDAGEPLYSSLLPGAHISSNMGTLTKTDDNKTKFSTSNDLSNVSEDDTVVILANEDSSNPLHLGGWGVKDGNTTTLGIWNNYTVDGNTTTTDLSYAIGNDRKVNPCEESTATAAVYAAEGYEDYLVKNGVVVVELRYDPYMVGKSTFIYANSTLEDKRIGIARRVDMSGTGPAEFPFVIDNSDNEALSAVINIGQILKLSDSHHKIQNARFSSFVGGGGCAFIDIHSADNIECDGVKYVTLQALPKKICSITMGDFKPEFE